MPAPSVFLEKTCDAGYGTFPAVVEGQKKKKRFIACIYDFVCSARRGVAHLCDGRKMGFEFETTQFVFRRARTRETARIPVGALDYIMIEQTGGSHYSAFFARDFHFKYLVNQGCPHAADGRPEIFSGTAVPPKISRNLLRRASRFSSTTRCWITICDSCTSSNW